MTELKVIFYHSPTDTLFQWGHLEAMFCALMPTGSGHIKGVEFSSWSDFKVIGLL